MKVNEMINAMENILINRYGMTIANNEQEVNEMLAEKYDSQNIWDRYE